MKSIIAIILVSFITSFAFSQKEDKKENKDNKENKETQNTNVTPGASGVKRSIGYRFSSSTGDADPGNGIFRYNNDKVTDVSYIFVDDSDIKGEDQTKWYSTWDDSTGATGRGQILVVKLQGEIVNIYDFTDVFSDGNGYWKLPVRYVSGRQPDNDSVYYYIFNRIAHQRGEGNEKVDEVEVVEKVAEVVIVEPAEVTEPEPVVAEVKVEEAPVVVVPAEAPVTAPVVEVKVEEAPVVVAPAEVPAAEPVVEVKVEEAPVVVVPAEVPAAEPVVEVKVEEAPVVVVPAEAPVTAPVVDVKVEEAPVVAVPAVVPEAEPVIAVPAVIPEPEPVVVAAAEVPPVEPAAEKVEEVAVVEKVEPVVVAEKVEEVVEEKVAEAPKIPDKKTSVTDTHQETTLPQGTQKPPVTRPAQETRPSTVYQPARVTETPVAQSYTGSSGTGRGKCYRGIIELGYGFRVSEYGMNNFRFNFINGFNIRSTSIGLGIGVRKYYDKPSKHPDWHLVSNDVQIPVFLDIRTHFSSKKVTPYLGIGIGTAAGFDTDTTNNKSEGLYFHATGGIWFNLSDRFAVFGGVAYETQRLRYADFSDEIIYNKYTNSISLNIGIAF